MSLKTILLLCLLVSSVSCFEKKKSDSISDSNSTVFDLRVVKGNISYAQGNNDSDPNNPINCTSTVYSSTIMRAINKVAFGSTTITCGSCSLEIHCTPGRPVSVQAFDVSENQLGAYADICSTEGTVLINNTNMSPPEIIKLSASMDEAYFDTEYIKCL